MQLVSWAREPHFFVDQRDDQAQRSAWPLDNAGYPGSFASPNTFGRRPHLTITISIAIIVVLSAVLTVYVCLLPRSMRKWKAPIIRRLSSSDDRSEDECQDLLASRNTEGEEENMEPSQPVTILDGSRSGLTSGRRKRNHSRGAAVEEGKRAKRPWREYGQDTTSKGQGIEDAPSPLASEPFPSSTHALLMESPFSPYLSAEGGVPEVETSEDAESAGPDWLDIFVGSPPAIEEWFVDFFLDPSSTSLSAIDRETFGDTVQHDEREDSSPAYSVASATTEQEEEKRSGSESPEKFRIPAEHSYAAAAPPPSPPNTSQPSMHAQTPKVAGNCPDPLHHPFYSLPRVGQRKHMEPFDFRRARGFPRLKPLSEVLTPVRVLLRKSKLEHEDLQQLIILAEKLVQCAFGVDKVLEKALLPSQLAEPLTRRFLLADGLWSICELVGAPMKKEEWWPFLAAKLLDIPSAQRARLNRHSLSHKLLAALEVFATGARPDACTVVQLKREIFCSRSAPTVFRANPYNPWREDDMC